ncbi:hypothetical protein AYL99_05215 [Fonsecaea erecta]|uniref:Glucose 1-dehydrogenase n=1 Tax=Fonsecaea erecta TaxID=1367422 RepID=A0A178ZLX1_9EURO|nr:hypothetical protein AYL99_05215 [Fonsecaea erecta]OAP60213.1 hypothetical protein AYL99_05215 [Fonsecaea erecta]
MAGLLRNKVVAITGASQGIGRATALACAQQGAGLVLHHLGTEQTRSDMDALQTELRAIDPSLRHTSFGGDVVQPETPTNLVSEAVRRFGRLDVLINNAGICTFADFHEVTPALLERHMAVNFTAAYMLTQAATRQMVAQGNNNNNTINNTGGSVVSIASITAVQGSSALTHYAPSKAAVLGMTVACASALGRHGIRFNSICPGTIETDMNKAHLDRDGLRAVMAGKTALGRLGTPEDIAGAAVFFASDLSAYVTGQYLLVDGGASTHYE